MAEDKFVTRKDLEDVTQKVAIQNSKDIAKPLVDQQKKNDLKELEKSIEQKALFQDIADGIRGLGDSLLKGLKSLIPKTDGGLSKLLGLGLGLLLAPFAAFVGFLGQLGRELNFFTKGKAAIWLKNFKQKFRAVFSNIFKSLKNSKLGKFISNIIGKIKNTKLFKSISSLFQKVFGGKGGFFKRLAEIFGKIVKFATGGPFKAIMKFAGSIGRILGKVFLPITILMSIFDFVKGFMRGYEEGGIIEGIKQGIMDVFDGLVGGLLRILMWIPTKIAEWLGFDNLAKAIGEQTENVIQSVKDVFGGLIDLVVGIFTWDSEKMGKGLLGIWTGIKKALLVPFELIMAYVKDLFGSDVLGKISDKINDIAKGVLDFFADIGEKIADKLGLPEIKRKTKDVGPNARNPNAIDLKENYKNKTPLQDMFFKNKPKQLPQMQQDKVRNGVVPTNNIINNYNFSTNNNSISTGALKHALEAGK
jgi:hypothetical protein